MSDERTIHLTKEEFDALMQAKYEEGYSRGYAEGQNDKVKEVDEFYEDGYR